jgi:hypothetical protein
LRSEGSRTTFRLASISKQISLIFRLLRHESPSFPTLPNDYKLKPSGAFTIMEVAMAATVLALTLVGMIGAIESGTQMLDLSRKQTIAGQILHGEMDEVRQLSWTTVSAYPAGPTTLAMTTGDPNYDPMLVALAQQLGWSTPYAGYPFTVTRTVACVQPAQLNLMPSPYVNTPLVLQVTYTVSWTGVTGLSYSRSSTTYVSQNGLPVAYQRS